MGDIESQIRNLIQQLSAIGIVGPQAEAVARSLMALRNATDALTAASQDEANTKSELRARTQELSSNMRAAINHVYDFGKTIISTADGMASSQSVFTQITPMITFLGEGFQKLGKFGGEIGESIGAAVGSLGGPVAAAAGSKLGSVLGKIIGGTLGELAHLASMVFNQYLQQGEKVVQAFNNLSTVGVTFGGSLTNMSNIIKNTGLPLEMLATIAKNNAENLALLGGGVGGALERVAKAARVDLGPQLVTLYGGFVNLSDELSDYLAMQQRRGVNEDLLSDQNIEGTKAYLYQLKEISALTGKSSKQIKSEIEARSRNAATQAMVNKMSMQEKMNYDRLMQSIPEGAREALHDLILAQSRGMEPVSEAFLQLQATAPGLTDAMRIAVGDLKKSPEAFAITMGKTSKDLAIQGEKLTDEMGDILYLKQSGRLSSRVISTLDTVLTDLNANRQRLTTAGDDIKIFAEQTKILAATSSGFTTSVAEIYGAQANLAVTLNRLILGDEKNVSKFTAFANTAVRATNIMNAVIGKFDDIVNKLAGYNVSEPGEIKIDPKASRRVLENQLNAIELRLDYEKGTLEALKEQQRTDPQKDSDAQIKKQEELLQKLEQDVVAHKKRIEELKNQKDNAEGNKESGGQARDESNPMPVVNPKTTKLDVNFTPLAEMLKPTLDAQASAIAELTYAVRNSSDQTKRAVDRIST